MSAIAPDVVSRLDRLTADLAAAIVRLRPMEAEPTIAATLRRLGATLNAGTTTFETFGGDTIGRPALHEWTRPGSSDDGAMLVHVRVNLEGRTLGELAVSFDDDARDSPPLRERLQLLADLLVIALQRGHQLIDQDPRLAARSPTCLEDGDLDEIIGDSSFLRAAIGRVLDVAPTDASVIILGETGTGKELFARAIHHRSPRRLGPFVHVNCAALPPALIESELFGHERGAFMGATSARQGRIEQAHTGTIFLDEIGALPADVQTRLLRLLQDREFERIGSPRTHRADVRVVAATRHDLEQAVKEGRFRPDLYYRLFVYPIALPPLRERIEDIPGLVWFFVSRRQRVFNRRFTSVPASVMEALQRHSWPGNVRELEQVIERAVLHSTGDTLLLDEGIWFRPASHIDDAATLEAVERRHIENVLRRCRGRINGPGNAAEQLGMHPNTLRFRMKKLGIRRPIDPAPFAGYKPLVVAHGPSRAAR